LFRCNYSYNGLTCDIQEAIFPIDPKWCVKPEIQSQISCYPFIRSKLVNENNFGLQRRQFKRSLFLSRAEVIKNFFNVLGCYERNSPSYSIFCWSYLPKQCVVSRSTLQLFRIEDFLYFIKHVLETWFSVIFGAFSSLVWCPGQNKRKTPLSFFHGCRKRRPKN
jgi:hypothetical protein